MNSQVKELTTWMTCRRRVKQLINLCTASQPCSPTNYDLICLMRHTCLLYELVYDLFHEDKNYPQYYCTIKSMLTFPNKVPTHSVVCQYTSAHLVDSRLCIYIYRYKVTSTLMGLLKNLTLWVHLKARFPEFPNAPRPSYFL